MTTYQHTPQFLVLSADDVQQALPMSEAIDIMQEAFGALSAGRVTVPLRTHLAMPDHAANALFMPVYYPPADLMGIKVVTLNEGNPERGLPLIGATVLLFNASDGSLKAMMDAESLTAIRTGAGSGLATRLLSSPDAKIAAIFGYGVQAKAQIEAISAVRSLEQIYIYGRSGEKVQQFVDEMNCEFSADFIAARGLEELRHAQIICTATTAHEPLFNRDHLNNHVLINAIGTYQPDKREISGSIMEDAFLVVDQAAACLAEAGEFVLARREGLLPAEKEIVEIGALDKNEIKRSRQQGITVFKSVGNAVQDVAAAARIVSNAGKLGFGRLEAFSL